MVRELDSQKAWSENRVPRRLVITATLALGVLLVNLCLLPLPFLFFRDHLIVDTHLSIDAARCHRHLLAGSSLSLCYFFIYLAQVGSPSFSLQSRDAKNKAARSETRLGATRQTTFEPSQAH